MLKLIASAKMHMGIDSAPMHIALAMGKEVVILWDSIEGEKSLQWVYHLYKNYHEQIWLKKIGDDFGLTKFAQSNRGKNLQLVKYQHSQKYNIARNLPIKRELYLQIT